MSDKAMKTTASAETPQENMPAAAGTSDGGRKSAVPLCSIPGCGKPAKKRDLCQAHYDSWYGKIRRARDKEQRKDKPFLKFVNPYREGSGYHVLFEIVRQSLPLTTKQIFDRAKTEMVKLGKADYRLDYAMQVVAAKKHSSKRGDYQMRRDAKGCWHLITDRSGTAED